MIEMHNIYPCNVKGPEPGVHPWTAVHQEHRLQEQSDRHAAQTNAGTRQYCVDARTWLMAY